MSNIKKMIIGILLLIFTVVPIQVYAEEESIYNQFIDNIESATNSHYILKGTNFDYYLNNDNMTVYLVVGEINEKLNLNILFVKKTENAFLRVNNNLNYTNYYANDYGIIYGIEIEYNTIVKIDICLKNLSSVLDSATLPFFESIDDYSALDITTTGGSKEFPENFLQEESFSTSDILDLIVVVGIIVCVILGVIVLILVKNKKVNIKREDLFSNSEKKTNDEYIDADYELNMPIIDKEKTVEEEQKSKFIYNKEYLTDLYRKRFNNEITEAEFDYALRKYLAAREDEDQDD